MRIVVADNQVARRQELRRVTLGEGLDCDAADAVTLEALPGRLAEVEPDLVLVACEDQAEEALAALRAAHHTSGAPLLAVGSLRNAELVRQAVRHGANEFLDLERFREELAAVVERLDTDSRSDATRGQVIALFSPSGGAGATTLAVNLAVQLARASTERTALVELQPAPGELAIHLDLRPRFTLDDVLAQWERMDRQSLAGAMYEHATGLRILAQRGFPTSGGALDNLLTTRAVRQTIMLARRIFAHTVLDLGHEPSAEQFEAMRLANFVGLVVRADVPGLRRARWALDTAASLGLSRERFQLIVNRFGGRGQLAVPRIEEALGVRAFHMIPDDPVSASRALNEGLPVSEFSKLSRISRSFHLLAKNVQQSRKGVTV
jgi:pilus assembly protein CpaE